MKKIIAVVMLVLFSVSLLSSVSFAGSGREKRYKYRLKMQKTSQKNALIGLGIIVGGAIAKEVIRSGQPRQYHHPQYPPQPNYGYGNHSGYGMSEAAWKEIENQRKNKAKYNDCLIKNHIKFLEGAHPGDLKTCVRKY